jgi:hypothetical protein
MDVEWIKRCKIVISSMAVLAFLPLLCHGGIPWDVLDSGGGRSSVSNYVLMASVGQTSIGESTGTTQTLHAGYLYALPSPPSGVPILPVAFSPQSTGSEFWVDIQVGKKQSQVSNLFGTSFTLNYDTDVLDVVTPIFNHVIPGPFLSSDVIIAREVKEDEGKIWIGLSRREGAGGVSGYGVVARMKFKVISQAKLGATIFTITEVKANDSNGNPINLVPIAKEVKIIKTPIKVVTDSAQPPGAEFWVDIQVGNKDNPVRDLYGVAFKLKFTHTDILDVVTPIAGNIIQGDLVGNDVIFIGDVDEDKGEVEIGFTKRDGEPINGYGVVAKVKFRLSAKAKLNEVIELSITDIEAYNPELQPVGLSPVDTQIRVGGLAVWPGDTDNNGVVNEYDIIPIGIYWQKTGPARPNASLKWHAQAAIPWKPTSATYADANGDGIVNAKEILAVGKNWGKTHPVPKSSSKSPALDNINHAKYLEAYRAMYELLANLPDTEVNRKLKQTLQEFINLGVSQQVPSESSLMQNYPNPFNPECWIPFSLSERAHVIIKIYNITGQLIRTLDLGIKDPGTYVSKDRAAYWDGLNDNGDEVASGVYFYQLQAGSYVSTKKMVVLK